MKEFDSASIFNPTLGLIVLQTDEVLENEIRGAIEPHVKLLHSRIPNEPTVSEATLSRMELALPVAATLLPLAAKFDVIGYACTSGAMVIGSQKINEIIRKIHPQSLVTDPMLSVIKGLRKLNCQKIGFVSPYKLEVSEMMRKHLISCGFEISSYKTFNQEDDHLVARISEKDVYNAVCEVGSSLCDAVFVSCTNLKTFNIIDDLEKKLKKPVISSNLALFWDMLRLCGIEKSLDIGALSDA